MHLRNLDTLIGPKIVTPDLHQDSRGWFLQSYSAAEYRTHLGIDCDFVQDNHSFSKCGTVRGMHFQTYPGQAKLIRVLAGSIYDVIVDIRPTSATFGKWEAVQLDAEKHEQLFIPIGFAHGFCVTHPSGAEVAYKTSSNYNPITEVGFRYDDPVVGIIWPFAKDTKVLVSQRDDEAPFLADIRVKLATETHIWLVGVNGLLGGAIKRHLNAANLPFTATNRHQLDITDAGAVEIYVRQQQFTHIINCAAYSGVDACENDSNQAQQASKVNGIAPGILASVAALSKSKFLHFSTDYVFDGTSIAPYTEDDQCRPQTVYGKSKLEGEQAIARVLSGSWYIIRTSSLFGPHSSNHFVASMLHLFKHRSDVDVVCNQTFQPTYTEDLAEASLHLLGLIGQPRDHPSGIYHFSNTGPITWYNFAVAIKEAASRNGYHLDCEKIRPVTAQQYGSPAGRPAFSVMDTRKISDVLGIDIRSWKCALDDFVTLSLSEGMYE